MKDQQCIRNLFNSSITINQKNQATIWFSEELSSDLNQNKISVYLDSNKVSFTIQKANSRSFKIEFDLIDLKSNSILNISFVLQVTSKQNSLLETK